jgi:putative copper resistance protein D
VTLVDNIIVWIHLTAATFWVGGMLFLSLVAVPLFKKLPDPASAQLEFINLARRFRMLTWVAMFLLIVTGATLLSNYVNFSEAPVVWPPEVLIKLSLVLLLIVVSLLHDQIIGPKVRTLKLKPIAELAKTERLLLRISPLLARLTLLLGLAILFAAVSLVRS